MSKTDLVDFGNYLLSKKRAKSILNKNNLGKVHDCDIENFKEIKTNQK